MPAHRCRESPRRTARPMEDQLGVHQEERRPKRIEQAYRILIDDKEANPEKKRSRG